MKSIRDEITRSLLTGILILGGVTGLALYFFARHWLAVEFDTALSTTARGLAMVTHFDGGKVAIDFEDELMPEFARADGAAFFQLRLASGETIERSHSLRGADLPARYGSTDKPQFWNLALPDGRNARAVGIRFVPEPLDEREEAVRTNIPAATLVIARDRTALDHSLATLRTLLIGAGLLSLAGVVVIVNRAVRRGLSPLADVGQRSVQINARTLDTRFPVERMPAELRPICDRLNELLARLENAFERERRFTADVSHELRTPLAELRSLAEVALRWPDSNEETATSFRDALEIAQQMESIVTALLVLARCEEGLQQVRRESINLAGLVKETWSRFAPVAHAKRLAVRVDSARSATIETDRDLLRIALENLFSNAVEYSPAGSTVQIATSRDENQWKLAIANTTSDLAPDDLPHLFERFWRKDSARTGGNHAGLGLSIARELAALLHLELAVAMPSRRTLEFSVRFPEQ